MNTGKLKAKYLLSALNDIQYPVKLIVARGPHEKGVGIIPSECKDDAIQETADDPSLGWIGL